MFFFFIFIAIFLENQAFCPPENHLSVDVMRNRLGTLLNQPEDSSYQSVAQGILDLVTELRRQDWQEYQLEAGRRAERWQDRYSFLHSQIVSESVLRVALYNRPDIVLDIINVLRCCSYSRASPTGANRLELERLEEERERNVRLFFQTREALRRLQLYLLDFIFDYVNQEFAPNSLQIFSSSGRMYRRAFLHLAELVNDNVQAGDMIVPSVVRSDLWLRFYAAAENFANHFGLRSLVNEVRSEANAIFNLRHNFLFNEEGLSGELRDLVIGLRLDFLNEVQGFEYHNRTTEESWEYINLRRTLSQSYNEIRIGNSSERRFARITYLCRMSQFFEACLRKLFGSGRD